MIEIFDTATQFSKIFEQDIDEDEKKENEMIGDNKMQYWERVFANATADAHKLFKS